MFETYSDMCVCVENTDINEADDMGKVSVTNLWSKLF